MEEERQEKPHSIGDVWRQLNAQGQKQAATDQRLIGIEARLSGMEQRVTDGFQSLMSRLDNIGSEVHRPANWLGIGSLIVAVAVAGATYLDTRVTPTESAVVSLEEANRDMSARRHDMHVSLLEQMADDRAALSYLQGQVDGLSEQVKANTDHHRREGAKHHGN